jgi:hypothetical protein
VNTITTAILVQAADAELEDWGPLEEATGDPMATHGVEPSEVGTGDIAVFPTGWKGTWDIHETVRKVYSIF